MNRKQIGLTLAAIGATISGAFLFFRNSKAGTQAITTAADTLKHQEPLYKGVPLSELTQLAKKMYHGLSCTIDQWGFLVFHCKSKRGHQTFHTQMDLDDAGKLISLGGHYPGEWWNAADEFAKQANKLFKFEK